MIKKIWIIVKKRLIWRRQTLKNLCSHTFQLNWWFTLRSTSCDGNLCTNIRKVGVSVKHRKLVRLLSRNFYLPSFYAHLPTHLTVHVFSITHLPAVVEIGCWNKLMRKKLNTFESKKFHTKWKFTGIFQFQTHIDIVLLEKNAFD